MNFSTLKSLTIPQGSVKQIAINGTTVWKKVVGVPISTLSVGSSVFMNVGGVRKEFLIVHQGLPSSIYDSSCNGTWLLMKKLYEKVAWDSSDHDYENSDIHSYLNNTFINLFDSDIKSIIKQVKIPYRKGTGSSKTVSSGSNGLSAKVFLPSYTEMGFSGISYAPVEGDFLSYFNGAEDSKRVAYLGNYEISGDSWWLRTPRTTDNRRVLYVSDDGSAFNYIVSSSNYGIRPTIILPFDTLVDGDGIIVV